VGTDRPTELIRIHADDTWEVVVGPPRVVDGKLMMPVSRRLTGFNNIFNGHFWRMQEHNGMLFLGTWDWSVQFRGIPFLDDLLRNEYGFDLYATTDGKLWWKISGNGFNDPFNYGVRTMCSTPWGMFLGAANPYYGLKIYATP
jgi:hypothetical protein